MSELALDLKLQKAGFQVTARQNLSLQGITVIWGQSGSGKSLLLRSIAGFEQPQGTLMLDGMTLLSSQTSVFIQPYQRHIAYVAQQPELFAHLTVKQNLEYGYKRRGESEPRAYSFNEVVTALGLAEFLSKKPATLSGGQKQRCAIAQALLSYPKLLLMDEPLSALDDQARQSIISYLVQIPRLFNVPIVYVTHSYEELLKLADHVVPVKKGRVTGCYPLEDYCSNYNNQALPAEQLCSVLLGQIEPTRDREQEYGLCRLSCEHQDLYIPRALATNEPMKIIIYAKDVSISLTKVTQSSILNLLEVTIEQIIDYSSTSNLLQLKLGQQTLFSLITKKSAAELNIHQGQNVIAQIKAVSIKA
ncbi:molybdenum ABC transporter ATP-binding protein [Kangiella koreensis]|uniref:Molybdate ABC transporter, ATPase subunit n=1 Tax=Kangiella koreensis (strain DSM 16069 / JCM 12317 / KCTC 12182 / SW-125) TaxID=523791 RepID=C7RBV6_KANKD|nr:molybdenum ABC transporter ATP-binding protein [Kangiella koreensis]ACV26748.1 molybdate ABC transporter, ATPase subunit [Kangiella koreensis DSM 16069]